MKKENKIKIIIIVCSILILLGILFLMRINVGDKKNSNVIDETSEEDKFRQIRIDEDLDTEGTVKNLQNARWNHVRINQEDNKLELELDIRNDSKTEVIPSTELTVNVKDKAGKTILSKNVQMEEIKDDYGYTILELDFDINDYVIVYDLEVIANK